MGHTEIAEPPGEHGHHHQRCVWGGAVRVRQVSLRETQITGQSFRIFDHGGSSARLNHTESDHDEQRDRHDDTLDQVRRADRQKTAESTVGHDDHGGDNHRYHVIHAEERAEQFAAGGKAGRGVGDEEDNNDHSGDGGQDVFLIAVAFREKVRDRDGAYRMGITADLLGDDQPVQIGAGSQPDHGPPHVGETGQIGKPGKPHKQIAAHVGSFRAHGGDEGTESSSAQIKIIRIGILFGKSDAYVQHTAQIDHNSQNDTALRQHSKLLLFCIFIQIFHSLAH